MCQRPCEVSASPQTLPGEPPSPLFVAWARAVLRWRLPLLALTAVTAAACGGLILYRLQIDTSIEAFSATDSEAAAVLEEYRDDFGQDLAFLVLAEGDVFSMPYLRRLEALHGELASLDVEVPSLGERRADRDRRRGRELRHRPAPRGERVPTPGTAPEVSAGAVAGAFSDDSDENDDAGAWGDDEGWGDEAGGTLVDEITSLINARRTRRTPDGGVSVQRLMDPLPDAASLPALREEVLADPVLVGQVVGAAGRHSVVVVRTQFMSAPDLHKVHDAVASVIARHQAPGFRLALSGLPALSAGLHRLMLGDLRMLLALALLCNVVVLGLLFRHPLGVVGPLLVVATAALNTFGLMAATRMPVTLVSEILPAFLVCVGVGDSVHLISLFRDELAAGRPRHEAIINAVGLTGRPVLFTSLTTMAGLLSFRLANMAGIQEMGLAGAFGVGMALLHTLVLLPIVLSFAGRARFGVRLEATSDRLDRFLARCNSASAEPGDDGLGAEPAGGRRRRRVCLGAWSGVAVAALVGVTWLRVAHDPLRWLPADEPVRQAIEAVDAHVGGTANVQIVIDAPTERGVKDRELLLGLQGLEGHLRDFRDPEHGAIVGNAVSVVDAARETHRALHGGGSRDYRVPPTQRGVEDALFLFESAGREHLRRLVTTDLQRTQMSLRIRWLPATAYGPLTEHIAAGLSAALPPGTTARATGSVFTLHGTMRSLLTDMMRSFGVAVLVITLFMILLLRDLKLGLVAMLPNLLPIAVTLGFMGWVGIPIDLNNLLIASVTLGIAVDDTIHFLHHFRAHHRVHGNVEAAIGHSLRHSGRAMVITSLILMAGFSVYLGARMINLKYFGLLVALTCGVALLSDLLLAPALLRTVYGRARGASPKRHPEPSAGAVPGADIERQPQEATPR